MNQSDEHWVEAIRQGGTAREAALREIYRDRELQRMVISFVRNHQGDATEGQDMYHEGIIVLDRNIREGKFRGESPVKGYLYSICRFLWMNQMRKLARSKPMAEVPREDEADLETPEIQLIDQERKELLAGWLGELGERCQRILELWKLSYSMEEIAEALGFSSPDMARKAKYRCHLSLLEVVKKSSTSWI
jgi:RNA polymerase sigma factor (sigma-70 family)